MGQAEQEQVKEPKPAKGTRKKAGGRKRGGGAGWRLTDRDKEIITFLARYKVATYEQIARYAQMHVSNVRHRIPKLETAGLVEVYRRGARLNLVTATSMGMKVVGLSLPVYSPSHGSIQHTLALTDLGVLFEGSGKTVVTEREIRAAWQYGEMSPRLLQAAEWQAAPVTFGDSDPHHGLYVVPPPFGKDTGLRIPDMVLVEPLGENGEPMSVAIEMELTAKEQWRYREIVSSYTQRGRGQFRAVLYYTPSKQVMSAVDKAISEGGAEGFMFVKFHDVPTDLAFG